MTAAPVVSTYSMWSLFRNCRKAVDWRYQQQLVPLQRDRNLHFGSLIHECLQAWHQRRDLDEVLALIDKLCPNHLQDDNQCRDWHLAIAMMKAYAVQYATEGFEVIALEKNFEGPIVNPATGAASRSFVLAGKVDGIVRIRGEHFILEHKTAAQIDSDYFAGLKAAGIGVVVSFSQELVNPPDNPSGGAVWIQRYQDGTPATTATGFGGLNSSMSAFGVPVETYMASVYAEMAGLMAAASLPPRLQFGEVLWWYIVGASGMGFYDADTTAAALASLGRPLATFLTANDDPSINGCADANFLRARLGNYVAAVQAAVLAQVPTALFELLWPLDVNDPTTCRLLHYMNLPPAWQARAGSGFDTFLCEGFQYGGIDFNLDEAQACAGYPFTVLSWDRAHCRYLQGWYYPSWPWAREFQAAQRTGAPLIKFWAYDHLCLYGWPLPLPKQPPSPVFL